MPGRCETRLRWSISVLATDRRAIVNKCICWNSQACFALQNNNITWDFKTFFKFGVDRLGGIKMKIAHISLDLPKKVRHAVIREMMMEEFEKIRKKKRHRELEAKGDSETK